MATLSDAERQHLISIDAAKVSPIERGRLLYLRQRARGGDPAEVALIDRVLADSPAGDAA